MIDHYEFGKIIIDGKEYSHDVIILSDRILDWWREESHLVTIEDLKNLPDKFDVLVIGSGASGCCEVPQKTIDFIQKKGIEVIVRQSEEAANTFNRLSKKGRHVVGAFHLTC